MAAIPQGGDFEYRPPKKKAGMKKEVDKKENPPQPAKDVKKEEPVLFEDEQPTGNAKEPIFHVPEYKLTTPRESETLGDYMLRDGLNEFGHATAGEAAEIVNAIFDKDAGAVAKHAGSSLVHQVSGTVKFGAGLLINLFTGKYFK